MVGNIYFNKYRVLREIGKGGMSQVFLAENIKLGNKWAIKRIAKKDSVINLMAEPSILKALNNSYIPRIVDIEEDNEYLYMIEEYVEGVTLREYYLQHKPVHEEKVIHYGRLLCQVICYLHSRKPYPIIYRDMKPSNIMVTKDDSIKLVDFGIAREYKDHGDTDTVLIGTHGYAAPEQYNAAWQSDRRTDIYSLGVTLYYLISGRSLSKPPYKILPIGEFGPYSTGLEDIISKCTQFNPDDRYQSIEEVQEALDELTKPEDVKIPPSYIGLRPQTIGVLSLTPRAGSTFLSILLARALARRHVLTSLIELPFNIPYIYDLMGVGQGRTPYYPVIHLMEKGEVVHRERITTQDGVMYLIGDPTRSDIEHWNESKSLELLYKGKDALVTVVDIGHHFEKVRGIMHEFDKVYVLYSGMPPELMANADTLEELLVYNETRGNIRFILNYDNSGINKKELRRFLGMKPYATLYRLPDEWLYKASYKKKSLVDIRGYRKTVDNLLEPILGELLPRERKPKTRMFY